MSTRLFAATRKGLFQIERGKSRWTVKKVHFLGDNATMVLPDPRDGTVYVALGHGHFGVKLHRLRQGARKWEEITTPALPARPEGSAPRDGPDGAHDSRQRATDLGARAGGPRAAGLALVRHDSRRALPFGRRRNDLEAQHAHSGTTRSGSSGWAAGRTTRASTR